LNKFQLRGLSRFALQGAAVLLSIFLTACDTAPKSADDCAKLDWRNHGLQRGNSGQPVADAWRSKGEACVNLGARADRLAFDAGWRQGQANYCLPRRALKEGRSYGRYTGVCREFNESEWLRAFNHGKLLLDADSAWDQAESDVRKAEKQAADTKLPDADRNAARNRLPGLLQVRQSALNQRLRLEEQANQNGWGIGR
jgi:Protein of unknown function (DUF2799)